MRTLEEIKGWTFYLSSIADCGSPDDADSAGMALLTSVRDAVVEAIEAGTFDPTDDRRDNDKGEVHQIADDAPDISTYRRWQEFVDLAAYLEEPETGKWPDDLTDTAGLALYQIAERLVYGLLREWREGLAESADVD